MRDAPTNVNSGLDSADLLLQGRRAHYQGHRFVLEEYSSRKKLKSREKMTEGDYGASGSVRSVLLNPRIILT